MSNSWVDTTDGKDSALALFDWICRGRQVAAIVVVVGASALAGSTGGVASGEPAPIGARHMSGAQDTSQGGLLLDKRGFRRLPDVPGALQTVHSRNNNCGQIAGSYVEVSEGTPRFRSFLMDDTGRVTRIDVPGAVITVPLGINDRGQVVGSYVGPDAAVDPDTGETGPAHGTNQKHVNAENTPLTMPGLC